jgi:RecJ-like exonuclease
VNQQAMENQDRSYWLRGEQECALCRQAYTFAVERICTRCDGASCPHCATIIAATREIICTGCASEATADTPKGS